MLQSSKTEWLTKMSKFKVFVSLFCKTCQVETHFCTQMSDHCSCWPLSVTDLTPPPAPVQSRHGLEAGFQNASRCRGPGCGAIGKAMLEGYCDKCYVKEQSARLNQVAHRAPHSPPLVMVHPAYHFYLSLYAYFI